MLCWGYAGPPVFMQNVSYIESTAIETMKGENKQNE